MDGFRLRPLPRPQSLSIHPRHSTVHGIERVHRDADADELLESGWARSGGQRRAVSPARLKQSRRFPTQLRVAATESASSARETLIPRKVARRAVRETNRSRPQPVLAPYKQEVARSSRAPPIVTRSALEAGELPRRQLSLAADGERVRC